VDTVATTIKLFDSKGKRSNPRVHQLPLTDAAIAVIERCKARALKQESDLLFSSHGRVLLRPESLSAVTRQIAASLLKSKLAASSFQLRDLRRTCETLMAGMGVSRDIRAQIQSHGLGGVQARHYDKHDYAIEKLNVLIAWGTHLEGAPCKSLADNVIPLTGTNG
jgi:integrase